MDNAQNANRIEGRGRFFSFSPAMRHINKQSGCDGREITVLENSKKHQLKKLSALGEDYWSYGAHGMGCAESDGEDELRSSNRFKLPTKFSDDCNTVYHVSVPRKLRSVIKKRSCDCISPPLPVSKKLNCAADGLKLVKKDGLIKSNLRVKQGKAEGYAKDAIPGPITKDEEEVAEALYALAGLFPNSAQSNKNKLEVEEARSKSSASPKAEGSVTPVEGPKAELEPKTILARDAVVIHSSNAEVVILHSCNDTEQPHISIDKQPGQACTDVREVNLPFPAFVSENEYTIQRPSSESVTLSAWPESSLDPGSKLLNPEKSLASWKYPEIALAPTGPACGEPKEQYVIEEDRDIDFSSRMLRDNEGRGIPLQSYNAKLPAWFESSSCISRSPTYSSNVAKRDTQIATDSKKSQKRCSTHVYISRFIKGLQTTERRDKWPMQSTQISTTDGSKEGAHKPGNSPIGVTNGMIGIISTDGSGYSAPEKNATKVRDAILLHKRLVQDQQQTSTSGIYTAQKQSLDFLSLPKGSSGIEASNATNKARQGPEALNPLRFPCLQSQHQPANPFPSLQNYYSSASFSGQPSAAAMQQVQLPAYVGRSPYGPPSIGAATSSSLESYQQQQQKRAPLLMAHYKSGVASLTIPNWQTGVPDPSHMFHDPRILFPPSQSSIEIIGSKPASILQQQQHYCLLL